MWFINNRNSFLIVLEAGKSKIKALAHSMSGESTFPGSWTAIFSLQLSGVSFTRVLIPIMSVPASQPNHLPKAPYHFGG